MSKKYRQRSKNNYIDEPDVVSSNRVDSIMTFAVLLLMVMVIADLIYSKPAHAEYGDVLMNNYSEAAGMRPVVFPHWFHRIRFRCKVCHADLGFKFDAGGNEIDMLKIIDGEYCGACHDGDVAWSVENCDICHSGLPGSATQVHGSTLQILKAPPGAKKE